MSLNIPRPKLDVERGPDWLLVTVHSLDFDPADPPLFVEQIWSLLEQHHTYRLVLELNGIEVLNSYMIAQLVELHRRIEEHKGVMRLCGLLPHNLRVLHTCRLDDRLLSYRDRRDAVLGLSERKVSRGRAKRDAPTLTIIADTSVDPDRFAKFLAELSAVYSELSGGDDLVIREGMVPALEGVLV